MDYSALISSGGSICGPLCKVLCAIVIWDFQFTCAKIYFLHPQSLHVTLIYHILL